jgi:hypothetical protein
LPKPRSKAEPTLGSEKERLELVGRISSGLAHELNGPVGIAIGFAQLARETIEAAGEAGIEPQAAARLKEYISLVENASIRARTLARRISAFSKMKAGEVSTFDLAEALEEAAALAAPAVKVAQIEIGRRSSSASSVTSKADRAVCVNALVRLMLLSPEALPGGGSVAWEVSSDGRSSAAGARFVLIAEPWGEARSMTWPVPEDIRAAFEQAGGSLGPSVSRGIGPRNGAGSSVTYVWELSGSLPAAVVAAAHDPPGLRSAE